MNEELKGCLVSIVNSLLDLRKNYPNGNTRDAITAVAESIVRSNEEVLNAYRSSLAIREEIRLQDRE